MNLSSAFLKRDNEVKLRMDGSREFQVRMVQGKKLKEKNSVLVVKLGAEG